MELRQHPLMAAHFLRVHVAARAWSTQGGLSSARFVMIMRIDYAPAGADS